MDEALISTKSSWRPQAKYLLLAVIALMILTVLYRDRVLLDPQHPVWEHYRSFKWWLLPHGVTGALALFLGPFQFSKRIRRRYLGWHRLAGRAYVVGVVIAAPLGIAVEAVKYVHGLAPLRLLIGSIGFGILFALTTGIGFTLARRRNIRQHQRWMTRSYAIGLVFLETRCVDQFPWLARIVDWPSTLLETHYISDLWLYVGLSLLAAEWILRYQRTPQERSTASAATA